MPLIGTAGHVDHGKSTLIERITGRDPDRWREEKQRGLTIDLGFAWTTLPGGTEVSIVDVPGHERFLKNMLAGIEAIDVALLVVAADEGWMPQSEEHLAVLDLLDVDRGVVALTKCDIVETELAQLAAAETEDRLAGTSLEGSPIAQVSAVTGEGLPRLLELLEGSLPPDPADDGRPRLWVDRSFPIAGAGTVVTGSLLGGAVAVEDTVEIYPTGQTGRVRAIQSHEESHMIVGAGRRVALNIGGIPHDDIARGNMVGRPGQWETSRRAAVTMRATRFAGEIDQRGAYQMHIGSASRLVSVIGISSGLALLQLDQDVPMAVGDRFILRDTGRRLVVAGGRILDPAPGATSRALKTAGAVDPDAGVDEVATRLLGIRGHDDLSRLEAHSGGGRPSDALTVGSDAVDPGVAKRLAKQAAHLVMADHEIHPLRPGFPLATLAERLHVSQSVAEAVIAGSDVLERHGPDVKTVGHTPKPSRSQEEQWVKAETSLRAGLGVPDEAELGLDQEMIALKLRTGELVRIAPGLVYLATQMREIRDLIKSCVGDFTVSQFRDVSGLSRKYAVPILEWSDREGLTVRRGDYRRVR